MSALAIHPVARIRTPFAEKFGVPRQSGLIDTAIGRVEFLPAFTSAEFVRGLDAFSHLWLLTGFHQNPPWDGAATVRPPRLGGNVRVGVFASRSPLRPNGIGLSLVKLLSVDDGFLTVGGVDCVDNTPVYDLKPYLPWCEAPPEARADWAGEPPPRRAADSIDIPEKFADLLGPSLPLVRDLLQLELRPAYQNDPDRTYGMTVAGWNIRWRHHADQLAVVDVSPAP